MALSSLAPQYFPGDRAILMAADETAAYPFTGALPAAPVSPALVGMYEPPEEGVEEGGRIGYGGGSPFGLYTVPGVRKPDLSVPLRLTGVGAIPFIQKALRVTPGAGAYGGLADLCLWSGVYGSGTDFVTNLHRFSKFSQLGLTFTEGEGEIMADCQFMSLGEQSGAAFAVPAYSSVSSIAFGTPLTWLNVLSCAIGTTDDYHARLMSLSLTINHNLERKGVRPDAGDNVDTSRINRALLPHNQVVSGEMVFHSPPPPSLYRSLVNSTVWPDIVVNSSNAAASTGTNLPSTFVLTIKGARMLSRRRARVDSNAQLNWRVPFVAADIAMTTS